jgi:hypothetical protein
MGERPTMGIADRGGGSLCGYGPSQVAGREFLGRFEDVWCPAGRWVSFRVAACRRDWVSCASRARAVGGDVMQALRTE